MKIYAFNHNGSGIENSTAYLSYSANISERNLEDWLFNNPHVIDGPELKWIARQDRVVDGSISDLIGIDSEGDFVVVELKRGEINADAVTQSLRYASAYYDLSFNEIVNKAEIGEDQQKIIGNFIKDKEINQGHRIILVGTGIDPDALSIIKYLSVGAESNVFSIEAYNFNFYHKNNEEHIFSFAKVFPEMALKKIIEEKREIRNASKFARNPEKIKWMRHFIGEMRSRNLEFHRARGQSYEAELCDTKEDGKDVWISTKFDNYICIAVPIAKNMEHNINLEKFDILKNEDGYIYYKYRNLESSSYYDDSLIDDLACFFRGVL